MTKLNYFKPIDELSEDFKLLSISEQQQETSLLLDNYLKHSRKDFKYIGENTSQTENIWRVYEHLKSIFIQRVEELTKQQ
jgi:hypothetical protein